MRPRLLLAAFALAAPLAAPLAAQQPATALASTPDTAGARRAVLDYVEGFYEGDTVKLARGLHRDLAKFGYARRPDGTAYRGVPMSYDEAMAFARRVKERNTPAPATAPKEITMFDVLDQTASAKLRAWWGIDYLLLARVDGAWKVTHVVWQSPPPGTGR